MSSEARTFSWEAAIGSRALASGIALGSNAVATVAAHALAVLAENSRLHLTTITEPESFVERHIGEAFEGAALLESTVEGLLVDLGSGNGYPGIPLAIARPGLTPVLVEASVKKAEFLRSALEAAGFSQGRVIERHVTRSAELFDVRTIDVLATRAMGGWERVVPKLVPRLADTGIVLLWATIDAESIFTRAAWSKLRLTARRPLPGRERSVVYRLSKRY